MEEMSKYKPSYILIYSNDTENGDGIHNRNEEHKQNFVLYYIDIDQIYVQIAPKYFVQ